MEGIEKIGIIVMNIHKDNSDIYNVDCSLNCLDFSIIEERYNRESGYLEVVVQLPEGDFTTLQELALACNDMVQSYEVVEEY